MGQRKGDILLVDDTPDNLRVLSSVLLEGGYKVRGVTSGKLALHVVQSAPPDIILLDVMMPDMDGYEVCQHLKMNPAHAAIPVVFISALDDVLDKLKAFTVGGVDYITKPFHAQEVVARVENQLKLLRLQNQLHEQNTRLRTEVQARQVAQEALEAALVMRDDLSNMLVHDLRNPVSTIATISNSLLQREQLTVRETQGLALIQQTAHQLNQLINDLLIVAKMDAGKLLLTRTETDVNQLIIDVVESMRTIAMTNQCELVLNLPESSQVIAIDANLMRRALDNLISNAIKYSPANTTITAELHYLEAASSPSSRLRIRILDQGYGLSEAQRQTIFDKFSTGDAVKGLTQVGLGLAFCKLVVEAHGGEIFVAANYPTGSVFTVEI